MGVYCWSAVFNHTHLGFTCYLKGGSFLGLMEANNRHVHPHVSNDIHILFEVTY